jgi:transcriptional regulator with XRE-family HTH domain
MLMGDKIQKVRKERGRSLKRLAEIIGISGPVVVLYERSEITPSVKSFNVSPYYLVDDTDSISDIKDKTMLQRLTDIGKLDLEDKTTIVHVNDSLLWDAKAKKSLHLPCLKDRRNFTMQIQTVKEKITKVVLSQPEDSTYDEIMKELAFARMVDRGLEDVRAGRVISNSEMASRIRVWKK